MFDLNYILEFSKVNNIKNKKQFLLDIDNFYKLIKDRVLFDFKNNSELPHPTNLNNKWIFDFRKLFLTSEGISLFSSIFWDIYEELYPFQVATLELGGVPMLMGVISEGTKRGKNLNGLIIRKERKKRGFVDNIEGNLITGLNVILMDDIINSGESLFYAIQVLKGRNCNITDLFSIINFQKKDIKNYFGLPKSKYNYLFKLSDFDLFDSVSESKDLGILADKRLVFHSLNPNLVSVVPKSSPIFSDDKIYLGGEGGIFYCIDYDGNTIWKQNVIINNHNKNILSSPILSNNKIIFGGYDGNLYFLDKFNGDISNLNYDADWIGSSPCVNGSIVYVGMEHYGKNKGSLVAIDFNSGQTLWQFFVDDFIHSSPIYLKDYNYVIIGSNCGKVFCLDGNNGKLIWIRQFGGSIKHGFGYYDGKVYFGSFDKNVYSISVSDGVVSSSYNCGNIVYSNPLVYEGNIFIGSFDNYFYHFDASLNLLFKFETGGKILSTPIYVNNDIICFASNDCRIYFYDFVSKRVIFWVQHSERITTKMYYNKQKNLLYFYDFTNKLWEIGLPKSFLGIQE